MIPVQEENKNLFTGEAVNKPNSPKPKSRKLIFALLPVFFLVLPIISNAFAAGPPQEGVISSQSVHIKPLPALPKVAICDYFIKNALIVDGSGELPYEGNLAVRGDTIVDVGQCLPSPKAKIIDAQGKIVAPGFIDIHTHTDDYWPQKGNGAMVLAQGITTHIVGNCGTSTGNVSRYLESADNAAINVGTFLGYKALRRGIIPDNREVTPEVLSKMEEQLAAALDNGAMGLSLGLSYYPQNKAGYNELLALAKVVKSRNALLAVHIRDEYDGVIPSVEELIRLAKESGARTQYSHIKAAGEKNWPKLDRVMELFDKAVFDGLDIKGDVYIYPYSSWDIGSSRDSLSVKNIKKILSNPNVAIGSDSGLNKNGNAIHPRAYGNAIAFLCLYVRDEPLLCLEEAVMKMTSLPAAIMNIEGRGLLAKGMKADIAVFNLKDLKENGKRNDPNRIAQGMSYVFVNGKPVIDEGKFTNILNGRNLRLKGSYTNK